jgi:hypothetical protein
MPTIKTRITITGILAVVSFSIFGQTANAAQAYISPYDDFDSSTHPDYNLEAVGYTNDDNNSDLATFFLHFKKPIYRTQFADGLGSSAAILIDVNGDSDFDITLNTDGYVLPANYSSVPGYAYDDRTSRSLPCGVKIFSNYQDFGSILGFQASKSCLGLPGTIGVMGYASYGRSAYDFAPTNFWGLQVSSTPTTPTTTTPTTTVATNSPVAPAGLTAVHLGSGLVKLSWTDLSSNEDGFLLQRNDTPVPAGTTVDAWPYKIPANSTSHTINALVGSAQVCFAVASYNKTGASAFTDFTCVSTAAAGTNTTISTQPTGSLTCNATWPASKKSRIIKISTDPANAGKRLKFEIFNRGKFQSLGTGRVRADGSVVVTATPSVAKMRGTYEIRATQGSRFICEGTIK